MKVNNTYPKLSKRKLRLVELQNWTRWPFLLAAYMCPIINVFVGGEAWSIVVLWSLWTLWTLVFSPSLVEYNRISQFVKLITYGSVLLVLLDLIFTHGWVRPIVTIVLFGGLLITGILFFTDLERQKQNMMPMLWMILIAFLGVIVSLIFWRDESGWELLVMGSIGGALLLACIIILRQDFIRLLKKRFHTK